MTLIVRINCTLQLKWINSQLGFVSFTPKRWRWYCLQTKNNNYRVYCDFLTHALCCWMLNPVIPPLNAGHKPHARPAGRNSIIPHYRPHKGQQQSRDIALMSVFGEIRTKKQGAKRCDAMLRWTEFWCAGINSEHYTIFSVNDMSFYSQLMSLIFWPLLAMPCSGLIRIWSLLRLRLFVQQRLIQLFEFFSFILVCNLHFYKFFRASIKRVYGNCVKDGGGYRPHP